ncbi:carboxylate--amine ligase [Halobaculum marinum]|uniref:Carboxylate--amine ligase n=1 Tax=Halobaculum marinum TaxID=3031996 RepID=A0ABD5WRS3_9EURY|nr:carboxylate--amine ligase [Halobaculum sp. DT55]
MTPQRNADGGSAIVPAIATASSTAALRSLGRRGVRTVAVSEHDNPPGFASRYCDETHRVPDPVVDVDGYEAALLRLASRADVETVLPFREADVYVLARSRSAFAEHVGTPWPDLQTLRGAQDRVRLFEAARAAGVAMPETRLLDEWDDWDERVVVKPRYTMYAPEYDDRFDRPAPAMCTTRYVAPNEEPDRAAIVEEMGHVPLAQRYVPSGDEYAFFAQYDEGEAVATFQHRQRRGLKYCGGPSAYRESVDIPELEAAGRRLLDELDWHGVAMVEFLRNPETGEFELMEVNPRFWSSLPFTVQAGVDFPSLYYDQAIGVPIPTEPPYEAEIGGHLLWGEALHLLSVVTDEYPLVERPSFARRLGEVATSLVRSPRFDYLSASDPGPFVRDVRNRAATVVAPLRRATSTAEPATAPEDPVPATSDESASADVEAAELDEEETNTVADAGSPTQVVGDGGHDVDDTDGDRPGS